MSAARSGPFTWSSFGTGYLVASIGDGGSPIVDVALPGSVDGVPQWVVAPLAAADAARLAAQLTVVAGGEWPALRLLPGLRDRVESLDAALLDLSADGPHVGADAAVVAVDDLLRRLYELRGELSGAAAAPSGAARLAAGSPAATVMTGPGRSVAADRRLTTMGGLALALGIVAVFWVGLGVLLWLLLT